MNLKKFVSVIMCIILTFLCSSFAYAANPVVKVTISIGQGESRDLSSYMKSDTGEVKWTNTNSSVASVSGKTVTGLKTGSTVLKGTSSKATYQFTIKVLTDYSTPTTLSTDTITNNNVVKNSKGETITYHDYYLTMGINDTLDISKLINMNLSYYNYSWTTTNDKCVSFKQGKITSLTEGVVKVSARSRTTKEKNTIYRFFVTVDSNCLAKNIIVGQQKLTPLSTYVGDNPTDYVYKVTGVNGTAVAIKDNQYIQSGSAKGNCIITAESTTGGNNYCFVVRTR